MDREMNREENRQVADRVFRWVVLILFGIGAAFVAWNTPYCHDEWKWASPERIELLKKGFAGYNGRYLGNLLVLLIVRSRVAKTLVLSAGTLCLVYLMSSCAGTFSAATLLGAVLLTLLIPNNLYAQSFGWSAAFVNFVPPVVLFLLLFRRIVRADEQHRKARFSLKFCLLILAFAAALFSEHNTLFCLGFAVLLFFYDLSGRRHLGSFYYLAGSAAGAICMFMNSSYRKAAGPRASYKQIRLGLTDTLKNNVATILTFLYEQNVILNVAVSLLVTVLVVRVCKSMDKKPFRLQVPLFCMWGFTAYSMIMNRNPDFVLTGHASLNLGIRFLFTCLYCFMTAYLLWFISGKLWILVYWLGAAALTVPLLAASPIGARCFFGSYIFQCIVVLYMLERLKLKEDLFFKLALLIMVLAWGGFYLRTFKMIGAADDLRHSRIEAAILEGESEVTLPLLPFGDHYWMSVPPSEDWIPYFRNFYGIPDGMDYTFDY